jgi:hypothetical protein
VTDCCPLFDFAVTSARTDGVAPIPGDTSTPRCGSLPRLQISFRSMLDEHVLVRIWLCRDRLIVLARAEQAVPVRKFVVNSDGPKAFGSEVNRVERVNALVSVAYKARVGQSSAISLVRGWVDQSKKRKHFFTPITKGFRRTRASPRGPSFRRQRFAGLARGPAEEPGLPSSAAGRWRAAIARPKHSWIIYRHVANMPFSTQTL